MNALDFPPHYRPLNANWAKLADLRKIDEIQSPPAYFDIPYATCLIHGVVQDTLEAKKMQAINTVHARLCLNPKLSLNRGPRSKFAIRPFKTSALKTCSL